MYKKIKDSESIIRLEDNAVIPNVPGNRMWDEYQQWLLEGNIPLEESSNVTIYPSSIEEAFEYMQQLIIDTAALKQEQLIAGYSAPERDTWDKKAQLSKAFLESNDLRDADYLVIEAISSLDADVQVTEEDIKQATVQLANRVLKKAEQLYKASFKISGLRTNKIKLIRKMTSIEDIIRFDYQSNWF